MKVGRALADADLQDEPVRSMIKEFPFQVTATGACEKYDAESKLCTVYETRPDVCRVDVVYDRVYKHAMSRQEYYRLDEAACESLQREAELTKTQHPGKPVQKE